MSLDVFVIDTNKAHISSQCSSSCPARQATWRQMGNSWEIHMELGIVTWKVRSHKINQNHPMFHLSHDEFDQCICSLNRRKTGHFAVGVSLINWWMVDFRRCKWLVTPWSKATWQWNALNVRISCDYSNVVGQYIYIGFGEMGDVDFVAARGHKVHKFNQS